MILRKQKKILLNLNNDTGKNLIYKKKERKKLFFLPQNKRKTTDTNDQTNGQNLLMIIFCCCYMVEKFKMLLTTWEGRRWVLGAGWPVNNCFIFRTFLAVC